MSNKRSFLIKLTVTAVLTAIAAILSRTLSITTMNTKIGFAFVPIIICGMLFGPVWSSACAGVADLLAAVFMPLGPINLGITLTAMISGVIYGLIGIAAKKLKKSGLFFVITVGAILLEKLVCTLVINSYWISGMRGTAYSTEILFRIPQAVILFVAETVCVLLVKKYVLPAVRKNLEK